MSQARTSTDYSVVENQKNLVALQSKFSSKNIFVKCFRQLISVFFRQIGVDTMCPWWRLLCFHEILFVILPKKIQHRVVAKDSLWRCVFRCLLHLRRRNFCLKKCFIKTKYRVSLLSKSLFSSLKCFCLIFRPNCFALLKLIFCLRMADVFSFLSVSKVQFLHIFRLLWRWT